MNSQLSTPIDADISKPSGSLAERLDPAIGETSTMMGAMLAELVRRALRGSVLAIDEELQGHVAQKVDSNIADRLPAIEQSAAEVADRTARMAATEVATEEVRALEHRTQESYQQLSQVLEQTAESSQRTVTETAVNLTSRIELAEKRAEETIQHTAEELTVRIEETEKQAQETTLETARGLSRQIEEAQKRAEETAQTLISRQVEDLLDRSRKATTQLKERLSLLDSMTSGLGKQLLDEASERKAEQIALRAEVEQKTVTVLHELKQFVQQVERERRAGEEVLRKEWRQALSEAGKTSEALGARVAELEKPRGMRALWLRLFGRKKKALAQS